LVHGIPLARHLKVMNAARKEAIECSTEFLTTQIEVLSIQDYSMAIFKPPMLALFTNVGSETPWGITCITWQVG